MIYDYECPTCGKTEEVRCRMSERDDKVPSCEDHGPMTRLITNNQKHTDDTPWRKGYYNSREAFWR